MTNKFNKINQNKYVYIILFFSLINVIYFINFFLSKGYLPSPFVMDKNNTFMDFYNPLYWAINETAYTLQKSVYPPLSFIFLSSVDIFFNIKRYDSALDLRGDNLQISIYLVLIYSAILLFSLNSRSWRNAVPSPLNRALIFISLIFSTPILFSFERGNIIFITIPILTFFIQARSVIAKSISFAFLVNLKPYFVIYLITKLYNYKKNKILFAKLILSAGILFLITSIIYRLDLYSYFYTYVDFTTKTPVPFFETLAMPVSINALTSLKYYSTTTRHYSTLFYLPTLLNIATVIFLCYLLVSKSMEANKRLLGATLVILNFSTNIGGYAYLFYIPIIPLLLQEKEYKKYIYLLSIIFIAPLDLVNIGTIHNNIFSSVHSYLGGETLENITHPLTLGSVIRPIANYLILIIFTASLDGRYKWAAKSVTIRLVQRINLLLKFIPDINPKNNVFFGFCCIVIVCVFYNIFFTFGSPPITEGWFLAIAHLISEGKIPYVDFYLYLTPLYPLIISWYSQIFGESFYLLRILGLLITTGIWCILYLLLRRKFTSSSSLLATVTAMVFYESGVAFISYDFTQVLILLFLCSIYMLCLAEFKEDSLATTQSKNFIFLFFAGFFASSAFLIKQSNGAFVVVFSTLSVILIISKYKKNKTLSLLSFAIGGLAPAVAIIIWLFNNGALLEFWDQIFNGALSAKGSGHKILFSWLLRIFTPNFISSLALTVFYISTAFFTYWIGNSRFPIKNNVIKLKNPDFLKAMIFFIFAILTICLSYYYPTQSISRHLFGYGWKFSAFIAPAALLTLFFLLVTAYLHAYKPTLINNNASNGLTVVAIMSVGLIWGNGTSGGISEMSLFLPLSIVICLFLDIKRFKTISFLFFLLVSASIISHYSIRKFNTPYYWWGIKEDDARSANLSSNIPLLENLNLSNREQDIFIGLANSIQKNKSGEIFAFPSIPIVYLLSDRWPNSKVLIQWFDFLPDEAASKEAARILATPPKTIVNLNLPEFVWDSHENIFRHGHKSGQRDIQNAINLLTGRSGIYTHSYSKIISDGYTLDVWDLKASK